MELRSYQKKAVQSTWEYLCTNEGAGIIVIPPGGGKSLILAQFCKEAIEQWPDTRIINSVGVRELVQQNYMEFVNLCPFMDTGIYSAGLKRRDTDHQILFCGIQSVYKKAYELQRCDILIIDECHGIPKDGEGMWLQFIEDLRKINPDMRIFGLSATPFRLDSGNLTSGDGKMFNDIIYEYGLLEAIESGYLCPVIPKKMATKFDLSKVGTLGGEYKQGELEVAVNIDSITKAAMDEIELYGQDRKRWLIFAAGNNHAKAIHAELAARGYKGECVTQDTERTVRDGAIAGLKSGENRYIVNNKILTTGTNIPGIDLIADLGPTKSGALVVQKLGRGTRLFPGKVDCLVLDFSNNLQEHGPLDKIKGKDKRKSSGDGDAPIKACPQCHEVVFAGLRVCFRCGFEFPAPELDIRSTAGNAPILSSQIEPEWLDVLSMKLKWHQKDGGKHPVMKVEYTTLQGRIREWVCFEHPRSGRAYKKAAQWHMDRLYMVSIPEKVEDAIKLDYPVPVRIKVIMADKWPEVLDWDFRKVVKSEPEIISIEEDIVW